MWDAIRDNNGQPRKGNGTYHFDSVNLSDYSEIEVLAINSAPNTTVPISIINRAVFPTEVITTQSTTSAILDGNGNITFNRTQNRVHTQVGTYFIIRISVIL